MSSVDPTKCNCPTGMVEGVDDKCYACGEEEVANENQTDCVGT